MAAVAPDFDASDLASRVEALSGAEIDRLPFGVIRLDTDFVIRLYNDTEAALSGFGKEPLGHSFFGHKCKNAEEMRGRLQKVLEEPDTTLDFPWTLDTGAAKQEMRMRVQTAKQGGVWIFIERD